MESIDNDITFISGRKGPIGGFNYADLISKCGRQRLHIAGNGQCHINSLIDVTGVDVQSLKKQMKLVFTAQKDIYMQINMLQYTPCR